ncbi:MAG: hypothetical protein F6K30_25800 [Cyanothece sp. SIO2G6]|nr:hypothetical protein [Cyanothece sp. SIO2G6]
MNTPMTQNPVDPPLQRVRWTTSDLEGFPDNGDRYEIIDGELFVTRLPHWDHQDRSVSAGTGDIDAIAHPLPQRHAHQPLAFWL